MKSLRLAFVALPLVAAGCVSVSPPDNTYAFRPGTGTVQNVQAARVAVPGGTAPESPLREMTRSRWIEGYQLALRMDDGTMQAITQNSDAFHVGDRVQVTQQGRVLKVPASASAPTAYRTGSGTVQAAAGGTGASPQEFTVRMDDGTTQAISVPGAGVQPGDRVTIGADGRVTKP